MNEQEAVNYIIRCLRENKHLKTRSYGYDIHLHQITRHYAKNLENCRGLRIQKRSKELYPYFYAAAGELCRRGILVNGVWMKPEEPTPGKNPEDGYSVTPLGEKWIVKQYCDDVVPADPRRFAEMIEPVGNMANLGFCERAQQAFNSYHAQAYVSCCAMCAAAGESIALALAIAKKGDKKEALKIYCSNNGANKIENMIASKAGRQLRMEFLAYATLLKYWRNEIVNKRDSGITQDEAYKCLALLLRFFRFTKEHWSEFASANAGIGSEAAGRHKATSLGIHH